MKATCATLDALRTIIDRNSTDQDQSFENGARLVCPLPWLSPNAWLHRIMPPCPEPAIQQLAPTTGRQPPRELVEFLRCANGLDLFHGSLKVYGVRGDFSRDPEMALFLPYDIASHMDRGGLFEPDDFLVGAEGPKVDTCVWRFSDGSIDRVGRQTGAVLESWPSFSEWLLQEAERFSALYSADGRLLEPLAPQPGKAEPWPHESLADIKPRRSSPAWWWDLEERLGLPFDTLPFGWANKLYFRALKRLLRWLERGDER